MKFFMIFMALFTASVVQATDIVGKVEVLRKGGQHPLKSFANSLVYLEGIQSPAPPEPTVMDQKNKQFIPRMLPVVKGQEVLFINSDQIQHNVFSTHKKEPFDLGRYPEGEHRSLRFDALGKHKIYCNIHQQMIADVFVLNNQFFAITDREGYFTIKNVPKGGYTIKVFHIFGGKGERRILVTGGTLSLNLTIISEKAVREIENHKNKLGQSYPVIPVCDINISTKAK